MQYYTVSLTIETTVQKTSFFTKGVFTPDIPTRIKPFKKRKLVIQIRKMWLISLGKLTC